MRNRGTRIERTNEKYNRAIAKELQRADKLPPEKRVSNIKELLDWLDEDDRQKDAADASSTGGSL